MIIAYTVKDVEALFESDYGAFVGLASHATARPRSTDAAAGIASRS